MIKAVLFDWNGVIIDDLEAVGRAECDVIEALGGKHVDINTWFKEITQNWHEFYAKYGVNPKEFAKVLPMTKKHYAKYDDYVRLTQNARPVLESLKTQGLKLGVLSSNSRDSIEYGIKKFSLGNTFDFIISGEDVTKHKPDPEGLLKAIEKFGVKASEIVYVDDMTPIFQEAKKLGTTTIGFKSQLSDDGIKQADYVCEKFEQIFEIIGRINSSF